MIYSNPVVRFLELDENAYELTANNPICVHEFKELTYGIRDVSIE